MLTLVYGANSLALKPLTEPTLDMAVSATLSGNIGNAILGDQLYDVTPLRVACYVVGDLATNISHYLILAQAVRAATQLQANVQGTVYTRALVAGGEIRIRGRAIAPKLIYELTLIPSAPWWLDPGSTPRFLWW